MRTYLDNPEADLDDPAGNRPFGHLTDREFSDLHAGILKGFRLALRELGVNDTKAVAEAFRRELGPHLSRIRALSKSGYLW